MTAQLYDSIVEVIEYYLGPAGRRFVDRQIKFHLNKEPHEVSAEDLPQLTEWIRVSLALLTDDRDTVQECSERLLKLGL